MRSAFQQLITFVGCANGHGGRLPGCGRAAAVLRDSEFLKRSRIPYEWANVVCEPETDRRRLEALPEVIAVNKTLAHATKLAVQHQRELVVIGGDHSCAIGTFSGVAAGVQPRGRVGLIWIDAHLDAHTPLTSHSGNLHGMPIAHLLGHGDSALCGLFDFLPKLRPEHLVLIGARSFEQEEREFLESMNVRIFYMEEVRQRGCYAVLKEAIEHTTDGTCGFTLSVDLDAFDPQDAPAIGCPETGGILADEFLRAVGRVDLRKLLATEVVEFLPVRDSPDRRTEKLVVKLIHQLYANKKRTGACRSPSCRRYRFVLVFAFVCFVVGFLLIANSRGAPATERVKRKPKEPRVHCWIATWDERVDRAFAVNNTWAKHCDKAVFVTPPECLNFSALETGVADGRNGLWNKTRQAFKAIYEKDLENLITS
ncbi:putative arginase [Aphelenchoides fujianensis]|nr:putative arginase [Aphelenchoides fujianensis]